MMKKNLLFVVLLATVAVNAGAQLTVYSSGKVGIGTSASDSIKSSLTVVDSSVSDAITVQSNGRGIYAETFGNNGTFPCGVYAKASSASNAFCCSGVVGNVTYDTPQASGRAYGLRGIVGNAANGLNYAVFGVLRGENNGAGVYGYVGSNTYGTTVDGRYAGYFHGATKVKGDLTVTGSIYGLVLGQPSTATAAISALSEHNDVHTVSDKLSTLSTTCYYIDTPVEVSSVADVDAVTDAEADIDADVTVAVDANSGEAELSEIERLAAERVHYGIDVNALKGAFPELVYEKEDGTVAVNYMEMIPILVQAINNLQKEIKVLKAGGSSLSGQSVSNAANVIISADGKVIGTKVGSSK